MVADVSIDAEPPRDAVGTEPAVEKPELLVTEPWPGPGDSEGAVG